MHHMPAAALLRGSFLAAAAALLLTGCSAAQKLAQSPALQSKVKIEPVVGEIWRASTERKNVESAPVVADLVYDRAVDFCAERGMGMLSLTGSSSAAKPDGTPAKAWLEFRCARPEKVDHEYKGITLHFDSLLEDEEKR